MSASLPSVALGQTCTGRTSGVAPSLLCFHHPSWLPREPGLGSDSRKRWEEVGSDENLVQRTLRVRPFCTCVIDVIPWRVCKASITLTLMFPFNRNDLGAAKQCAWDSQEPCVTEEFYRYCLVLCLTAALGESASLPLSRAKENAVITWDVYLMYTVM